MILSQNHIEKPVLPFTPSLLKQASAAIKVKSCTSFSGNEFLSAICHELKTPLSAIIAFSDILKDEISTSKSVEECLDYVKEIKNAASDLFDMVHDLLDVQKVESGNFSLNLDNNINLHEVLRRSIKLNSDYALKKNITLKLEIAENLTPIKLDEKRMRQIFINLISNALKYSPDYSEIKITALEFDDFLEISVADQGFGMNKFEIETAFLKYKTIANQSSRKVDSFGFGLPIVKHLVEMQGGKIEIESEPKKGTKVVIRFKISDNAS